MTMKRIPARTSWYAVWLDTCPSMTSIRRSRVSSCGWRLRAWKVLQNHHGRGRRLLERAKMRWNCGLDVFLSQEVSWNFCFVGCFGGYHVLNQKPFMASLNFTVFLGGISSIHWKNGWFILALLTLYIPYGCFPHYLLNYIYIIIIWNIVLQTLNRRFTNTMTDSSGISQWAWMHWC